MRHQVKIDKSELWHGRPIRKLCWGLKKSGGRSHGRIAVRHIGGGCRQLYRMVDFKRKTVFDQQAIVQRLEYDPNRNAYIMLVRYEESGELAYLIAPQGKHTA